MKAVRVHEYGGPEVLQIDEVPRPTPGEGEVLVDVHAAGVNPIDWMVREGYADEALDPSLPYVPGWDCSGVVEAVGDGVSAVENGDAVFGLVGMPDPGETYGEYAAVPASDVVRKPQGLKHTTAAALPMVALTAWRAIVDVGALERDERVLVHAAAGGVGHLAVQLAAERGAHVIGTASARNQEFLEDLGVDEVVDYQSQPFESAVEEVDLVLDAVGGDTLDRSIGVLRDGGRVVTLPEPPDDAVVERADTERDADVHWFSVEPDAADLRSIRTAIDDGVLEPTLSSVYPLRDVTAAHRESEAGHVRGKLVLDVSGVE